LFQINIKTKNQLLLPKNNNSKALISSLIREGKTKTIQIRVSWEVSREVSELIKRCIEKKAQSYLGSDFPAYSNELNNNISFCFC